MIKIFGRDLAHHSSNYNPEIDGLRAIAVLAVIISHFNEFALPSGYLGVDMFFVISGFVIGNSLLNRENESKYQFFLGFYLRRIKRLFPVLLLCFVSTGFLISFFNPTPQSSLITGLLSLVGFSNFNLYFNAIDYWGESARLNPFTHTWSLGVEEQFYMIFPLLLWSVMGQPWSRGRARILLILMVVIIIASLAFFLLLSNINPVAAYFLLPTRMWEIGLGSALAVYLRYGPQSKIFDRATSSIPRNGLILSCVLIFFISKEHAVWATLLIVFCTLLLIHRVSVSKDGSDSKSILKLKPVVYIGMLSYSLYLWHWVILSISRWTIESGPFALLVQACLIAALSIVSFHFLEQPFRSVSWRTARKVKIYFASMLFLSIVLAISVFYSPSKNALYLGGELNSAKDRNYEVHETLKCNTNEDRRRQRLLTMGNSHAFHILPMLEQIAQHCNLEILTYENPRNLNYEHPDYVVIPDGQGEQTDQIRAELGKLDAGDLVVLSSRNKYLYNEPYLNAKGESRYDHSKEKERLGYGLDNWLRNLDDTIIQARDKNINVIFFMPNVEFNERVVVDYENMCRVEWFRPAPEGCNLKVSRDYLDRRFPEEFEEQVLRRKSRFENFYIFDPLPIYCGKGKWCTRLIDGVLAFRDTNHLTPEGSMLMLNDFSAFLAEKKLIPLE